MPRGAVSAVLAAAALLVGGGCSASACVGTDCPSTTTSTSAGATTSPASGEIDTAATESATQRLIAQQTGAQVRSVSCPTNVAERAGATFTCTATGADGTAAPVLVTQQDNKGNVHISAPTLLHTGVAASMIGARLTAKFKIGVTVRCPDLLNGQTGTTFTCHGTDTKGVTRAIAVTVTDAHGDVHYRLE